MPGCQNAASATNPWTLKTPKRTRTEKVFMKNAMRTECDVTPLQRWPEMEMRCVMCRSCGSSNQTQFGSEIMIHFSGLKSLDKLPVMVFPKILVCLDCGVTEFTVPKAELDQLVERGAMSMAA
jgi:Zn ribbon nucleic-acid-binding protein